jgi:hypothetical protein
VGAAGTVLTDSERLRIETHVLFMGSATIASCAELLMSHPDPESAVLALVHAGRLVLNWDSELGSQTVLRHVTVRDIALLNGSPRRGSVAGDALSPNQSP